jgi:hypothetical protein
MAKLVGEIMQKSASARALRARFMGVLRYATIACGLAGPAAATVTPETVTRLRRRHRKQPLLGRRRDPQRGGQFRRHLH